MAQNVLPSDLDFSDLERLFITPNRTREWIATAAASGDESVLVISDLKDPENSRQFAIKQVINKVAFSVDNRFVAVNIGAGEDMPLGGTLVFDLTLDSAEPAIRIEFENFEGDLLAFDSQSTLLTGSLKAGALYRFNLFETKKKKR